MSWMEQLANVYERNHSRVGEFEARRNQRITLLPVSHVMQSAQIEVLVSLDGDFISAKVINKENARTTVPATPGSANRANTSAPHYIHDKLAYVAGDYVQFGGNPKYKGHHPHYMEQMKKWTESEESNLKVIAIHSYLSKGTLIQDLANHKIMPLDEKGLIMEKWPVNSEQEKPEIFKVVTGEASTAFVRFDVIHELGEDSVTWEDKKLFDSFIRFFEKNNNMEDGYCYVTGESTNLTTQHGSRVRNAGDMAKLISGNDTDGFTYRGRFSKQTEAVQISYKVSQKAHHALRWLIQRQGTYVDSRYFVTFGMEHVEVPLPFESTADLIGSEWDNLFLSASEDLQRQNADTEELVAKELNNALHGLKHSIEGKELENIIVMALDAATTGRLAIVYYQQIDATRFFESIKYWHSTCKWLQSYKNADSNQIYTYIGTPSTYRIAEAVYGSKGDSRMKKDLYTRLLPCIVEQKSLPKDLVSIIFNRVKNPFSFTNTMESWSSTLNIACALISKYFESEGYGVAIQEGNNSRDYLFGRLLGISEVMERGILKDRDENRATNATRYFNAFSQHPARTWQVIRKQLAPYFERSGTNSGYYAMLIQQLEDRLTIEQMTNDPLGPIFLLGYSSQIQMMYTKKGEKDNVSIES